jgi:multiple sugar transport system permease protein
VNKLRNIVIQILCYGVLLIGGGLIAFPFIWMFLSAFKTPAELLQFTFFPERFRLDNFQNVLANSLFLRWYANSAVIASVVTLSVLLFSSLAGFAIAKYRFRMRQILFVLILSTMMIPLEMLIIPWYILGKGLVDTYIGVALPGMISAFGVFLMKQASEQIPDALLEAARVDGAGEFRVFFQIALPLLKPSLASLGIFTFLGNWNAFLWPLIITNQAEMFTLPVGLQYFSGQYQSAFHLIMAASCLTVLPVLLVFLFFQKYIIKGMTLSALKG